MMMQNQTDIVVDGGRRGVFFSKVFRALSKDTKHHDHTTTTIDSSYHNGHGVNG